MESDKSSEFRERGSIFKQMAEMKKKIQLVEVSFTREPRRAAESTCDFVVLA